MDIEEIVNSLIAKLLNRGGFDGWWDGIDDETQADIRRELGDVLEQVL